MSILKKNIALYLLIVIYPIIFKVFQGLDLTDIGFYAVNYQQIFKNPENISYSFVIWLSNIIGGLWLKLFEPFGLLGLNISGIVTIYITILFTFFTLNKYIETNKLLFSLFISEVYICIYNYPVNYNNLTSLFFSISIYFLIKSLEKDKLIYILVSSFILSSSIFVRIPNVLSLSLFLIPNLFILLRKDKKITFLKYNIVFLFGYLIGIIFNITVIMEMGHLNLFLSSLGILSNKASSSGSTHNIKDLIYLFSKEYVFMIILGFFYLLLVFLTSKIFKSNNKLFYIYLIGIIIQSYLFWSFYRNTYHANILIVCFFINISLLSSFFVSKDPLYKSLILSSLLNLFITPLGSNNGILNATYGMWLAIPLTINQISKINQINFKSYLLVYDIEKVKLIKLFLISSLISSSLIYSIRFTYRDSSNRFLMTYPLENEMLYGIYTTKERAEVVNPLLLEIKKYVKEGDNLLTFSDLPLINFVTKTNPYGKNSWLNLYEPSILEQKLEESYKKDGLPIAVVLNKYHVASYYWPEQKSPPYGHFEIIKAFIAKHNYKLVWENSFFQIWKN